jgi:tetratricopeptide (TPR) repeat protein
VFFPGLVLGVLCGGALVRAGASLTEAPRLAAAYDTILSAKFTQASSETARACPPAPAEACQTLGLVSLWWQIQLDINNRALDRSLTAAADRAIGSADAWTKREPRRAEAWFYLAGSYAPLTQWRVFRGEKLAAARDGNRIRVALERAIAIDPSLNDAYFGIGLYHYYADVAPTAAKVLRWLLFLPGGDRERGLREMLQARDHGEVLTGEADYQLHWLYLWYENKPAEALALLKSLDARYPSNPIFLRRIAEVERDYFHDHAASAAAWQALLERSQRGEVSAADLADADARLGLGTELTELNHPDRAIDAVQIVIARRASAPYEAQAAAQFALGSAYDRQDRRDLAMAAYRAASALAPNDDPLQVRSRARARLERKF